jgi:hypothetical protein
VALTNDDRLLRRIALYEKDLAAYVDVEKVPVRSEIMTFAIESVYGYPPPPLQPDPEQIKKRNRLVQRRAVIDLRLQKHLKAHLAPQCLDLCQQMQEKLPRELRNYVHEYTLEDRTSYIDSQFMKTFQITQSSLDQNDARPASLIPGSQFRAIEHVADVDYVGTVTLSELAYTYYRVMKFVFNGHHTRRALPFNAFLFGAVDPWNVGSTPSKLVRKLELCIYDGDLDCRPHRILAELALLQKMQNKMDLSLQVWHRPGNSNSVHRDVGELTCRIFPTVNTLRRSGHDVSITITWDHPVFRYLNHHRCGKQHHVTLKSDELTIEALVQLLESVHW